MASFSTITSSGGSSAGESAVASSRLRCSFQHPSKRQSSTTTNSDNNSSSFLWFRPNQGKRSSFLLDLKTDDQQASGSSYHVIPEQPCHCYIECVNNNQRRNVFMLGGFQLISTARSVQVYVTRQGATEEEELLMTCRGIPIRDPSTAGNLSDCFKVFSVVPGGARPVTLLRLCLNADESSSSSSSSSKPTTEAAAEQHNNNHNNKSTKLVSIQLTGRIPDPPQTQSQTPQPQQALLETTPNHNNNKQQQYQENNEEDSSFQMMKQMQQMMMMTTSTGSMGAGAATPLASGSSQKRNHNPFFSSPSAPQTAVSASQQQPPTPQAQYSSSTYSTPASGNNIMSTPMSSQYSAHSQSSNNNNSTEAILAGVHFMVRTEGQATVQMVQQDIEKHSNTVQHQLQSMDQRLQQQQSMMESIVNQQQSMMQKQYDMMHLIQQQQQQLQQMQWFATMNHHNTNNNHHPQHQQNQHQQPQSIIVCEDVTEQALTSPLESTTTTTGMTSVNIQQQPIASFAYDPTCRVAMSAEEEDEEETPMTVASKMGVYCRRRMPENRPRLGLISSEEQHDNNKRTITTTRPEENSTLKKQQQVDDDNDNDADDEDEEPEDGRHEDHGRNKKDEDPSNNPGGSLGDENDDDNENNDDDDDDESSNGTDERIDSKGNNDSRQGKENASEQYRQEQDELSFEQHSSAPTQTQADEDDGISETSPVVIRQSTHWGGGENEQDDDQLHQEDDDDGRDSIMQKQLVFVASKKGVFPSQQPALIKGSEKRAVKDQQDPLSKQVDSSSMLDHWSIHVGNGTVSTGLPSLPPSMTMPSIDQAESIEVLAVFPDSPACRGDEEASSPTQTTTTLNTDQTSSVGGSSTLQNSSRMTATISNGGSDLYTEGQSSAEYDEEGSYDGDDEEIIGELASVSLMESENVNPTPRQNISKEPVSNTEPMRPAQDQRTRNKQGPHPQQTIRENVFFSP